MCYVLNLQTRGVLDDENGHFSLYGVVRAFVFHIYVFFLAIIAVRSSASMFRGVGQAYKLGLRFVRHNLWA